MQSDSIQWYHHYLQHPGETRLELTLKRIMYWPGMTVQIRRYVKTCERCQKGKRRKRKYGKLPPKIAETVPWNTVSVDLIEIDVVYFKLDCYQSLERLSRMTGFDLD